MRGLGIGIGRMGMLGLASMGALLAIGPDMPATTQRLDVMPSKKRMPRPAYGGGQTRTTWHRTNGKRERDRRVRQIAAGSLRVENGLVA